ncbi:hypothetical protein C7446_1189 [Kushneria sinocarnis]|uniref:Uncharacterized protein n=1 Tax=Kushneria sinocarnis TaxID=595502 RepID=A0A420WYN3_9GAMM|nr:hypothetical protein [Kushneria sinocarnis]RKR06251.1 hypothetical protein C7446_1189 [Kushneria sinocarnis]
MDMNQLAVLGIIALGALAYTGVKRVIRMREMGSPVDTEGEG